MVWDYKRANTFSTWSVLEQGVPQGSALVPVLFNIYVNELFFTLFSVNVRNFANDTTPFVCNLNLEVVFTQLEECSDLVIAWFQNNYMKSNTDDCHFLLAGHKFEHTWVRVGPDKIWEVRSVKLLGVLIENELKFDKHILNIIKKANSRT